MDNQETSLKHREVYIFYTLLVKHIGKERAAQMNRKDIYGMVAEYFYINTYMVARIVNAMLRNNITPNRFDVEDFRCKIGTINQVVNS